MRIVHTTSLIAIIVGCIVVAPLAYSPGAHERLDVVVHAWAPLGGALFGLDMTAPRRTIFSLASDLGRDTSITDHWTVYGRYRIGLVRFFTGGSLYTVADAMRWFHIPLTVRQARALHLCEPIGAMHPGQAIVIQADPYQYGIASWYGPGFNGRLAASGEIYDMNAPTAAHKTLPMGSVVRVVARRTGHTTIVRINDRGPYIDGRTIDLSYRSKELLGMNDLAAIYLERIDPTALNGDCK